MKLLQVSGTTNAEELCLALLKAEYEEEVTAILRDTGYLDSSDSWQLYANWSIVSAQQAKPVDALVDKLVNSIDAVLISECHRQGIAPESASAPRNMVEAVERFFGIPQGRLANASPGRRTELASQIFFVATGAPKSPSYIIADKGEGQSPARMPTTLLSLPSASKPYKSRIQFVQGVFNMGGSGVLPFSSPTYNYQLLISRRAPHARDPNDPTAEDWGFTIIRRRRPTQGERMSRYEYLAPGGKILSFSAVGIPALPGKYPNAYQEMLEYGTVVKLYEYQISPARLRAPILLDLNFELSRHFVAMAVPIRICERRKGYTINSYETTLSGMDVRLAVDRSEVLEDSFANPPSGHVNVLGFGSLPVTIYAFKEKISADKDVRYRWHGEISIAFTINGQVHYQLTPSFLMKKSVNLDYVSNSVLAIVDCTPIPLEKREDLIMGSRDRVRFGDAWEYIEGELEHFLKDDEALKSLNEKRKAEELQKAFGDDKPLEAILERLLKVAPSLGGIFGRGIKLAKPISFQWKQRMGPYAGKRYPTFFRLKPSFPNELGCPLNGARMVPFETDAENHYFTRPLQAGTCTVSPSDGFMSAKVWNGIARVTIAPPPNSVLGDRISFHVTVTDSSRTTPVCDIDLALRVEPPRNITILTQSMLPHGPHGPLKRGRIKRYVEGGDDESGLQIPKTVPLEKSTPEWTKHFSDDSAAIDLNFSNEQIDLIYVNMSNPFLLAEMAQRPGDEVLVQNQYRIGLALATVAVYHSLKTPTTENASNGNNAPTDLEHLKRDLCNSLRGVAMIVLPMINAVSSVVNREMS
jgi:hypothetical protein